MANNFFKTLTFGTITLYTLLAVAVSQVLVFISNKLFGTEFVHLGWIILLLINLISVGIVFQIFTRDGITRSSIVAIIVIAALAIGVDYFLPKLIPEVFNQLPIYTNAITSEGLSQLNSMINP